RQGYIPHVGMGTFESYANRGILGLMQSMKNEDELLGEVMVFVENDEGKKELVKFKEIDTVIKAFSMGDGNKISKIREYMATKRKAKKLLKEGKNEDGSELQTSEWEMASAM